MVNPVKDKFVQIRATEDERALLAELADENNMTVSQFVISMARYFKQEKLGVTFVPKAGAPMMFETRQMPVEMAAIN